MVITTSPLVETYTLHEFWDLPEPPDRSKLELLKGVLYMTMTEIGQRTLDPAVSPGSQSRSGRIASPTADWQEFHCGRERRANAFGKPPLTTRAANVSSES
jgi:hypothetical protein